jgi:hypothetical protein
MPDKAYTVSVRAEARALGVSHQTVWRKRIHDDVVIAGTIVPRVMNRTLGLDNKWYPAQRNPDLIKRRNAKIREWSRNGVPQRLIAGLLGCSTGTVHKVVSTKRKRKRRPSLGLKQRITQRIEAGQSPREIAAELGCTVPDIAAQVWDREI